MKRCYLHNDCPEIAANLPLFMESDPGIGTGIIRFIHHNSLGNIHQISKTDSQTESSTRQYWHCDGTITQIAFVPTIEQILQKKCPSGPSSEELHTVLDGKIQSFIQRDNKKIAEKADKFFLQHSFRHFTYVSSSEPVLGIREQGNAFSEMVEMAGLSHHRFPPPANDDDRAVQRKFLGTWFDNHPKSLAIFAVNDFSMQYTQEICLKKECPLPYEAVVLEGNNAPLHCPIYPPSPSSTALDWKEVERTTAGSFQEKMADEAVLVIQEYTLAEIIQRTTTKRQTVSEKIGISILEFIRIHQGQPLRQQISYSKFPFRNVEYKTDSKGGWSIPFWKKSSDSKYHLSASICEKRIFSQWDCAILRF